VEAELLSGGMVCIDDDEVMDGENAPSRAREPATGGELYVLGWGVPDPIGGVPAPALRRSRSLSRSCNGSLDAVAKLADELELLIIPVRSVLALSAVPVRCCLREVATRSTSFACELRCRSRDDEAVAAVDEYGSAPLSLTLLGLGAGRRVDSTPPPPAPLRSSPRTGAGSDMPDWTMTPSSSATLDARYRTSAAVEDVLLLPPELECISLCRVSLSFLRLEHMLHSLLFSVFKRVRSCLSCSRSWRRVL
jgi:hypothetical protein